MSNQPRPGQWQSVTTDSLNATIIAGQTVSDAIDLQGTFLVGALIPNNFDGTELQFKISRDGDNFFDYKNSAGDLVTATVSTESYVGFVPSDFAGIRYIKLVSVTTQTTTNTIIGLVTRPLA